MSSTILFITPIQPNSQMIGGGAKRFFQEYKTFLLERHIACDFLSIRNNHESDLIESVTNPLYSILLVFKMLFYIKHRHISVIYPQDSFYCGFPAFIVSKISKIKYIIHYHNSPIQIFDSTHRKTLKSLICRKILELIEHPVCRSAHKIIVTNKNLNLYLVKKSIDKDRIFTIPMGTVFHKYNNCHFNNIPNKKNKYVYSYIGRLSHGKGLEFLIDAFSDLTDNLLSENKKNLHLNIVGEGDLKNYLESKISNKKLNESVHLLGYRHDIYEILKQTDVFVYPSASEGCPLSILEAMGCEVPVIATNIIGINDIITDNYNGLLFSKNNKNELTEKMILLYENDCLRKNISKNAKLTIQTRFDKNMNYEKIFSILVNDSYE